MPLTAVCVAVWCVVSIWFVLFFGGALLPSATGVCMNAVDPSLRSMASSYSMFAYNLLGYACAPFICGLVADKVNLKTGFQTVMFVGALPVRTAPTSLLINGRTNACDFLADNVLGVCGWPQMIFICSSYFVARRNYRVATSSRQRSESQSLLGADADLADAVSVEYREDIHGPRVAPTANGHANGHTNGHANGHANGVANGGGKHGGHLLDEGKEPKVLEIGEEEDFGTSGLQPAEPPGVTPVPGRE